NRDSERLARCWSGVENAVQDRAGAGWSQGRRWRRVCVSIQFRTQSRRFKQETMKLATFRPLTVAARCESPTTLNRARQQADRVNWCPIVLAAALACCASLTSAQVLNDPRARKAVDDAVTALGGPRFLSMHDRVEIG